MSDTLELITVNTKKEYHNCEMTFCLFYNHPKSIFKVDKDQKYKIHTTLKEIAVFNEALTIFQEDGFKDAYLLFSEEIDGSKKYPDFVERFKKSQKVARELNKLSNDEDSLEQLQEYCEEQAPTYADDFGINKQIESIRFNNKTTTFDGYEDLKQYLTDLS